MMNFNLKEKCESTSAQEFFYGAMVNHDIQDVYLGLCYLEPNESDRKTGPGKGHEEIFYLLEGEIEIILHDEKTVLKAGEVFHIPEGHKVKLTNLTSNRVYIVVAGGHPKQHSHEH